MKDKAQRALKRINEKLDSQFYPVTASKVFKFMYSHPSSELSPEFNSYLDAWEAALATYINKVAHPPLRRRVKGRR